MDCATSRGSPPLLAQPTQQRPGWSPPYGPTQAGRQPQPLSAAAKRASAATRTPSFNRAVRSEVMIVSVDDSSLSPACHTLIAVQRRIVTGRLIPIRQIRRDAVGVLDDGVCAGKCLCCMALAWADKHGWGRRTCYMRGLRHEGQGHARRADQPPGGPAQETRPRPGRRSHHRGRRRRHRAADARPGGCACPGPQPQIDGRPAWIVGR